MTKVCTKCRQTKDETEFYLAKATRKDGSIREFRRSQCCACETARKREADKRTKEQRREQSLLRKYGLDLTHIEALLQLQKGRCGICGATEPGGRYQRWNVDHCHDTGKVRGLLCWDCNVGIGKLKDDANLLRRAIQWLEQSEQPELSLLKPSPMENCEHFFHE